MALKYLLQCGCGESLSLDASQAGSTIPCACGKMLEVPTLRDLRKLPQVEVSSVSGGANWSVQQGAVFSLGLLMVVAGIGCVWYAYPRLRAAQPMAELDEHKLYDEQLADFTPSELFDAWKEVREFGLVGRGQNPFVISRKYSARMKTVAIVGIGMGLVGGIAIVVSLVGLGSQAPPPK